MDVERLYGAVYARFRDVPWLKELTDPQISSLAAIATDVVITINAGAFNESDIRNHQVIETRESLIKPKG